MQDKTAPPRRKRGLVRPYLIVWIVLALAAVGYLGVVAARPDLVARYLPAFDAGDQSFREAQKSAMRAVADVQNVRQNVGQLQAEVARLRSDLRVQQENSIALAKRTAVLEDRMTSAAAEPPEPEKQPVAEAPAARPSTVATAPLKRVETASTAAPSKRAETKAPEQRMAGVTVVGGPRAALPPLEAELLNSTGGAPAPSPSIETGSLNKAPEAAPQKPVSFGPATVKPQPRPIGIELASATSIEALRLSWSVLADRHGTLKNLEARYVSGGETGTPSYDLVAGPFKTTADARKACKELSAQGSPCKVGPFLGNAL